MIYKVKKQTPGQRRRNAKLKKILNVAMNLICDGGIESLTINKLADELDYTPGALYRYFSSKDEIIAELEIVVINALTDIFRNVKTLVNSEVSENTNLVSLLVIAEIYKEFSIKAPSQFRLLAGIMADPRVVVNDNNAEKVMETVKEIFGEISESFKFAMSDGDLNESNSLQYSILYYSALQGVLQTSKLSRLESDIFNKDILYKNMVKSLLIGWGAKPEKINTLNNFVPDLVNKIEIFDSLNKE